MAYYDNTSGGQFGLDPELISEAEEQGLSPYSVENGTTSSRYGSTQVTRGGSTSDKESETRKIQDKAQVHLQEFVPVNRTANASPYMSMLGQGGTPMADPRIAEQRALRQARTQALVRLAGNLGRMGASDADGVTGPISRDQSSNNYLTSMKAYQEALPKYNAALAKQNAALTKAQADLAKAQMEAQRAYDIQDAKSHNMVNYGNSNKLTQAERDYVTGNTVTKTGSHTNNTNNSTTTLGGWKYGNKQNEVRKDQYASGSSRNNPNAPLTAIPHILQEYDADGKMIGRQISGTLSMGKQDFKSLLYAVERNALMNKGDGAKWLKEMGMTDKDANSLINGLNKELNEFYANNSKKGSTTYGDVQQVSAADLDDEHLFRLWNGVGRTLANYKNLKALQPYMANIQFTTADGKKYRYGDWVNGGFTRGVDHDINREEIKDNENN